MITSECLTQIVSSLDKQFFLDSLVGTIDWHFDLVSGVLSFGRQFRWHVQLLGTESVPVSTWRWAWANTDNRVPDRLLDASRRTKAFGEQHSIPALTLPEVPLVPIDGHALSLLASSICQADAYYRCPHDDGALFVLIKDETFPKCSEPPLARIATVFPQVIASLRIPDHRLAFTGYLAYYGLGYEQNGSRIVVKEAGEPVLVATFDEQNRLTNLEVQLSAGERRLEESWEESQVRRMLRG